MKIYYISLEKDYNRRDDLLKYFPKNFSDMCWIKGVDGSKLSAQDYFNYTNKYLSIHNRIITPGELGCALSHLEALEDFIKTNEEYAIILEDDIVGSDDGIEEICSIVNSLSIDGVLICGGQTSNRNNKYQLGRKTKIDVVLELSKFSYQYIFGTCCYSLNRVTAKYILESHQEYIKIADNWNLLMNNYHGGIYYTDLFYHPDDRSNSNLQKDRLKIDKRMSFLQRVISGHFFIKNFKLIKNYLVISYLFLLGYRRIR